MSLSSKHPKIDILRQEDVDFYFFTIHSSLFTKNKTPLGKPKGVEFTRYHLVRRQCLPQRRFNGRTRDCLPVGNPAPRPCSSVFFVPALTLPGSLTEQLRITLLFTAFGNILAIIARNIRFCQHQK